MNPQAKPKPSWFKQTFYLLLIGLFLTGITVFLPHTVANQGYDSDQARSAILPPGLALCSMAIYLSAFRKDMHSSGILAHYVIAICCVIFLGFIGLFEVELRSHRLSSIPAESFYTILGFLCAAAFTGLCCWLKYIKHKIRSVDLTSKTEKQRFYLRELFQLTFILLFIVLNAFNLSISDFDSYRTLYKRQTEIFASREDAPITLPQNATRIHYSRKYNKSVIIEFDTDEQSFIDWVEAETQPWPPHLKESLIKEAEYSYARRFYGRYNKFIGPPYADVKDGLEYNRLLRKVDLHAIYDRSSGRAYCSRTKYP